MEIIEQIGSYAGFAAVLGLAVLSALYFSQARDVRRLREWAGRAPERSAQIEAEAAARAAAARRQPARAAPTRTPAKPVQAGPPKPAQAAAAGAAPAVSTGPAATAGTESTDGGPATGEEPQEAGKPADEPVPVQGTADAEVPAAVGSKAAAPPAAAAAEAATRDAGGDAPAEAAEPRAQPAPPAVPRPATAAAGGPGTARPARPGAANGGPIGAAPRVPPARPRPGISAAAGAPPARRDPWYRRIAWPAPRYLALLLAGVVIVGGGAAYGVDQLLSEDEPATTAEPEPAGPGGRPDGGAEAPVGEPVNRSTVTVSVLNGTTVGGLAAQVADKVAQEGFQVGNIDNALDQAKAESAVLYAAGARREGREVARVLGISQIEQVDPESQARGGNASVLVIVGADQTR